MSKRWDEGRSDDESSERYRSERGMLTRPPDADIYRGAGQERRGSATPLRLVGAAVVVLCLLALLGLVLRGPLAALLHPGGSASQATPSPTASAFLPAFSDWRVAYVGQDVRLHAISLDGHTDVTGPSVEVPATQTSTFPAAPPDGHYLAYPGYNAEVVVPLTRANAPTGSQDGAHRGNYSAFWSPDGKRVVGSEAAHPGISITTVATWQEASVPGTPLPGVSQVLGWLDNAHLLLRVIRPNATSAQLDAIDVSTGALRVVASFPLAQLSATGFWLSPDGARVFAVNAEAGAENNASYVPFMEVIDTATGTVHKLPNTLKLLGTQTSAVAWSSGSAMLAVSTGDLPSQGGVPNSLKVWLVDTQHDTARQVLQEAYPLAWAPGSDGHTLITSTGRQASRGAGPFTISAVTIPDTGTPVTTTLTKAAMTYPLLGLIRTA